jgi:tRNA 5-methylaminomethyl-2-thiouridine biosynthesis bifunctional protein
VDDAKLPGLCVCTAMGSRGLSFAVLCGELLAAWLHAEPLPMDKRLAQSLLASRHVVSE